MFEFPYLLFITSREKLSVVKCYIIICLSNHVILESYSNTKLERSPKAFLHFKKIKLELKLKHIVEGITLELNFRTQQI